MLLIVQTTVIAFIYHEPIFYKYDLSEFNGLVHDSRSFLLHVDNVWKLESFRPVHSRVEYFTTIAASI